MCAYLSQAVTGVFLAMYYEPDPARAYESAARITNEIFLGELVRGMHRWGSTVMILLVFLHLGRTFFFGAYKYPRELNWIIGVILLVLTLLMGFTGYLLPFDQRSFWATVVGVNLNSSGPIRSEEHTSELQSRQYLVCRLLLEKKKTNMSPTVSRITNPACPACPIPAEQLSLPRTAPLLELSPHTTSPGGLLLTTTTKLHSAQH